MDGQRSFIKFALPATPRAPQDDIATAKQELGSNFAYDIYAHGTSLHYVYENYGSSQAARYVRFSQTTSHLTANLDYITGSPTLTSDGYLIGEFTNQISTGKNDIYFFKIKAIY